MSQLINYDELAQRHNAAYAAFESIYETKNPPPVKPGTSLSQRVSLWLTLAALLALMIACLVVSGSRTVPAFSGEGGNDGIGWAAFVMLDVTVIFYAFFHTRQSFNHQRHQSVLGWTIGGLILAFLVLIAANIYQELKDKVQVAEEVKTVLLLLLAVSAPTLAFISGEILAVEYLRISSRQREIDEGWNAAMVVYQTDKNATWAREKSRWGVKIDLVNIQPNLPAPESPSVKSVNLQNLQVDRPSPKLQKALDWLALPENQHHVNTESRQLSEAIGVSHMTINKAQRILKNGNGSHGENDG